MKRTILTIALITLLTTGALIAQTYTCVGTPGSTNCGAIIPDAAGGIPGSVSSTIQLPALCAGSAFPSYTIYSFGVDILHNYVGDLRLSVTAPDATTLTLLDRPVTAGDCGSDDIITTFSDGGGAFPCLASNPASGVGPLAPVSLLSDAQQIASAGTWTLTVTDHANTGIGALRDWSVSLFCATYPTVTVAVVQGEAFEGIPGRDTLVFEVTRSSLTNAPTLPSEPLVVYFTLSGTASGADYTPNPISVTIPAGQLSAQVTLTAVEDTDLELGSDLGETVDFTITPGSYLIGAPAAATGFIYNSAALPGLSPGVLALLALFIAIAGAIALRGRP